MKQNKSKIKQPSEFYEIYFKNTTYCVLCKRLLIEEEYMFWTSYGIEKTEFIVGLLNNGREYLEEKLREQTS